MKRLVLLSLLFFAVPAVAVDYETQQGSSGPLQVSITSPTTDFVGAQTSVIDATVVIENFSSNMPSELWWGVLEDDVIIWNTIWEEVVNPSLFDDEYDNSTDTWSKVVQLVGDISFYESDSQAEVYAFAQMTSPNYTASTALILVNLVIDMTPPETTVTSPAAGTYGQDITFTFAATDDYTQTGEFRFSWKLDPLEATYSAWDFADSKSYTGLAAGNYTFYVSSADLANNQDASPAMVAITVETVSAPDAPSGPSTAGVGQEVTFTASGALSSEGHVLQYRFDFGDGTITAWSSSSSANHTYISAGTFQVKAQARCPAHSIESAWSSGSDITVETVSAPNAPSGPSTATTGQEVAFSASGAVSSEGHTLEYRFDFGDGTITSWSSSDSASHTYASVATFEVKAQARCPVHSIESGWSSASSIDVTAPQSSGGCLPSGSAAALAWLLPLACAAGALRRRRVRS